MADTESLYARLSTIRLFRLSHGPPKLAGELVSFALDSTSCPPFVALSYTWGETTNPKSISINGHRFEVLAALYRFLYLLPELKGFSAETWWWIDSICINQKDEKEKSEQMAIMGKIYEKASKTVAWLGEEGDCGGAVDSLYRLRNELDKATRKDGSTDRGKMRVLRHEKRGIEWEAIERLLSRPWWRRVWTLQEFLISNDVSFFCGKRGISRENFEDAILAMSGCDARDGLMDTKAYYAGWNRRRMKQWYPQRKHEMSLVSMLAYVGDSGATDERDRVYSLLGVAKDFDLIAMLDPKSTVEDVYSELVRSFIAKYKSLDIICYSHLFNYPARKSKDERILPSWIPDWRASVEGKVIPVMACQGSSPGTGNFRPAWVTKSEATYRASGNKYPRHNTSMDPRVLTCTGVVLDKIDGLGGSKYEDAGEINETKNERPLEQSVAKHNIQLNDEAASSSVLMETIARCLALDRQDRYLAESLAPGVFREDFETFCKVCLEHAGEARIPVYFREWFERNRTLLLKGRALEEHCRDATLHTPTAKWEDFCEGPLKYFHGRLEDTVVTMARRLAVTKKGHLGMAASRATRGDLICVLYGCNIPVLLREQKDGTCELVGECYLDGFMNGEALANGSGLTEVYFHIA